MYHSVMVIFAVLPLVRGDFSLTILHTNDVHSRITQVDKYGAACTEDKAREGVCYGGVARRFTKLQEIRNTQDNVVLVDGGDQFQGTTWFYYYEGKEASHFMNKLKYDVMALGNHEFDNGVTGLVPFLEETNFPVLSCNLDSINEPLLDGLTLYSPSTELMINGEKFGFVGYTTNETAFLVHPSGIANIKFLDEITEIQKEVNRLISKGINKIVAVGHAGIQMDIAIATEVSGLDVVVGGHTDTFLYTGTPPDIEVPEDVYPLVVTQTTGRKVLVVQDYTFAKYLGRLQVSFDDEGEVISWSGNPILLDNSTAEDPDILADVESWKAPLINFTKQEVGESYVFLNGDRLVCRTMECNLGNLVCDALLYQHLRAPVSEEKWSFISAAFWNSGGIRSSINMGPVTLEDILAVLPFSNTVAIVKLRGLHLLEVLEHSVSALPLAGRFLQFSGIVVEYDLSQQPHVKKAYIRCADCNEPIYKDLERDTLYSILTSEFLVSGGDGYSMIEEHAEEVEKIGTLATDCLADYFKSHSPIVTGQSRRIIYSERDPVAYEVCAACTLSVTCSLLWTSLIIKSVFVI